MAAVGPQPAVVGFDQVALADGGHGLQLGQVGGPLGRAQLPHARADRAGSDQRDLAARWPSVGAALRPARRRAPGSSSAVGAGQHARADLDDDRVGGGGDFLAQQDRSWVVRESNRGRDCELRTCIASASADVQSIRDSTHCGFARVHCRVARNLHSSQCTSCDNCAHGCESGVAAFVQCSPRPANRCGQLRAAVRCGTASRVTIGPASMSELHHECGVAAIYHLPGREVSPLCPEQGPGRSLAADAADAARHPEPRPALGRHDHATIPTATSSSTPTRSWARVSEVFRLSHRGKSESLMRQVRRPGGHRPRPLRHLRRRRPQLRPAVRAAPRAKAQVVQLRLQRPVGQLPGAAREAAGRRRQPPGPRHRHRNHHARDQPRAVGRPPAVADRDHAQHQPAVRRRLQPGAAERAGRDARGPRSAGHQAAVLCHRRPAVRRGQRERGAAEPGLRAREHQVARCRARRSRSSTASSRFERFAASPRQAHCFFEWIYFANVASTMDDRSVYLSRKALGEELARLETVPIDDDTIVVPVPDTSKAAADAMAYALGVPSLEGLIRNRYTGRTFIEGSGNRKRKAETKYTPLREVLEGKRVLLVEDSIVRSTTMKVLLEPHSRAGPGPRDSRPRRLPADHRAVLLRHRHVDDRRAVRPAVPARRAADRRGAGRDGRRSWAPIRSATCRSSRSPARSASTRDQLCQACITGDYPTPAGQELYQIALAEHRRPARFGGRTRTSRWLPSRAGLSRRANVHLRPIDPKLDLSRHLLTLEQMPQPLDACAVRPARPAGDRSRQRQRACS